MVGAAQDYHLRLQRSNRMGKVIPSGAEAGDMWQGWMQLAVVKRRQTVPDTVAAEFEGIFAKIAAQIKKRSR